MGPALQQRFHMRLWAADPESLAYHRGGITVMMGIRGLPKPSPIVGPNGSGYIDCLVDADGRDDVRAYQYAHSLGLALVSDEPNGFF